MYCFIYFQSVPGKFSFLLDIRINVDFYPSYITSNGLVILQSATQTPYTSTRLPQGKESEDYNVTIKVVISDNVGAREVDTLTVKVRW